MKLAKIKDGYMFKSENPNGDHLYCLYYDKKSKSYRAIQTTHLYRRDEKRFKQVDSGMLLKIRFPKNEISSGVRNYYYTHNINGEKIDIKNENVKFISNKHLPKWMSDKIKAFSVNSYTTKKRKKNSK